jgi:hypothetical protein
MLPASTLVLRLSVPANGDYRAVAAALAVKVAEYVGQAPADARAAAASIEALVAAVVPRDNASADVTFEFRQTDDELLIEARCGGRASEAHHPLPT